MFLLLQMSAQPIQSPLAVSSTSYNHVDPMPTSVQTGGSISHQSVLGYTLHHKRVYDANKFGVNDADDKITLKMQIHAYAKS